VCCCSDYAAIVDCVGGGVSAFCLLTYLLTYLLTMCAQGGVIVISIHWECNLDWSVDYCLPEYSFSRLDDKSDHVAKGSNFRSPYNRTYAQLLYTAFRERKTTDL